jgi:phenylalanine-4-hydroxylase
VTSAGGEVDLVALDRDHPGFRDAAYRARRNAIARLALDYRSSDPIPEVEYTDVEHGVWEVALENLAPLHARYACQHFHACWPLLGFRPDRVPRFEDVNRVLGSTTGFRLVPVAGLVSPRAFLTHLASGTFLATQYIRHHSQPLYTPEPDVIHEMVGHSVLLASPEIAALHRLFGEATLRAEESVVEALIRVYWYAMEFGVARRGGERTVLGAGLLSSFGELGRFEARAQLLPFDIPTIAATPFDPTNYQGVLFEGPSTEEVLARLTIWLKQIIR